MENSEYSPQNPHQLEEWIQLCEIVSQSYRRWKGKEIEISIDSCPALELQQYLSRPTMARSFKSAQLTVREELMMSITPFELQSHVNPILWAKGAVLVAGLGLGYYINQIKNCPTVKRILVVEKEQEVIDAYLAEFGSHSKIQFHQGDVFKFHSDEKWDFFYIDIWPIFEFDKTIKQTQMILSNITCERWAFWGIEFFLRNEVYRLHQSLDTILKTYQLEWMQNDIVELERNLTAH